MAFMPRVLSCLVSMVTVGMVISARHRRERRCLGRPTRSEKGEQEESRNQRNDSLHRPPATVLLILYPYSLRKTLGVLSWVGRPGSFTGDPVEKLHPKEQSCDPLESIRIQPRGQSNWKITACRVTAACKINSAIATRTPCSKTPTPTSPSPGKIPNTAANPRNLR